eukprot:4616084-Pyramimonas_sp.AAC.1
MTRLVRAALESQNRHWKFATSELSRAGLTCLWIASLIQARDPSWGLRHSRRGLGLAWGAKSLCSPCGAG